jgi:hypothetical protein
MTTPAKYPRKPRTRWRVTRWDGDHHPPRTVATYGSRPQAVAAWAERQAAEPARWFFVVKAPANA